MLVSSLIAAVAVSTAREAFLLTLDEVDEPATAVAPGARFAEAARNQSVVSRLQTASAEGRRSW